MNVKLTLRHKKLFSVLKSLLCLLSVGLWLSGCGFQLQSYTRLPAPLHSLYLASNDPYGQLARYLKEALQHQAQVTLTTRADEASTSLVILSDTVTQTLLTVSNTQQTRQYNLVVKVVFQLTKSDGSIIIAPQTISENHAITIQASQILAGSNETTIITQQMRRTIAYAILNRLSSTEATQAIAAALPPSAKKS